MTDIPASKVCTKCNEDKDLGDFYRNKRYRDGHQSLCKVCDLADQKLRRAEKPKKPKFKPDPINPKDNKVCCKCKQEKPKSEFSKSSTKDGLEPRCGTCRKEERVRDQEKIKKRSEVYYRDNRETILAKQREHFAEDEEAREIRRQRTRKWFRDNPERAKAVRASYYTKNRETVKGNARGYYHSNRDARVAYRKEYVKNNYEAARESDRASWQKNKHRRMATMRRRYKRDIEFRLRTRMKNMLSGAVRAYGLTKTRTLQDLDYSPKDLRARLEVQFKPGMGWHNYGDWHIDHRIPIARMVAKGETRQNIIHALSNLQPMWAEDNFKKGARWVG